MKIKERAEQLKTDIPAVFLALKAKETSAGAKIFAALAVAYALSPVDLIPDFIPVIGYVDDLLILPSLIALAVRCIPKEVFDRYREQALGMWENGKPKRWYYAVPILLVWILAFWLIVRAVWLRQAA